MVECVVEYVVECVELCWDRGGVYQSSGRVCGRVCGGVWGRVCGKVCGSVCGGVCYSSGVMLGSRWSMSQAGSRHISCSPPSQLFLSLVKSGLTATAAATPRFLFDVQVF